MSKGKRFSDYEKFRKNPYVGMASIELVRKTDYFGTDTVVFQGSTGEVSGVGIMARRRKVDGERFIKLYTDRLASWLELTKNAQKVLVYLIGNIRPGNDNIVFNLGECMEVAGYRSEAPIYNALAELIDHNIIARSAQPSMYFLNPYFMFSGDRVMFMESLERNSPTVDSVAEELSQRNAVFELPETADRKSVV